MVAIITMVAALKLSKTLKLIVPLFLPDFYICSIMFVFVMIPVIKAIIWQHSQQGFELRIEVFANEMEKD